MHMRINEGRREALVNSKIFNGLRICHVKRWWNQETFMAFFTLPLRPTCLSNIIYTFGAMYPSTRIMKTHAPNHTWVWVIVLRKITFFFTLHTSIYSSCPVFKSFPFLAYYVQCFICTILLRTFPNFYNMDSFDF